MNFGSTMGMALVDSCLFAGRSSLIYYDCIWEMITGYHSETSLQFADIIALDY